VVVTDTQGNSTAPIEPDSIGSVPGVTLFSMAADAKMISLPVSATEQYTITFNVNDEPLALRIVKGENNVRPTDVIHYLDIDLPAGVLAKLVVSPAGFENLRYDSDGNGTYDASVSPTIVLSGSAALDITAPTLAFAESPQSPTVAQVSITAADIGTGVRDVNYSTDGSQFQAYTSALSLDPTQTPFISAFATDSAGNRSPIIRYSLGSPPIRIRGTVKNHADNLLSGATITLRGTTSATAQTDIHGNYEFANLPAGGFYELSASLSGFGFSSDDRVVSNPITDKTIDFVGEGACEVAIATSQPTAQTVCEGSSASFSVTATGTNLSFQWRKNGVPLSNGDNVSGADSATVTINSVGPGDADTYDVVITASCAPSVTSNEATLTVIPFTDTDGDGLGDCIDPYSVQIVFTSNRAGNVEIYGMKSDGTGVVRLTNHPGYDHAPALSPDRTKIVFASDRSGNYEIYSMNIDGTGVTQLTTNRAQDRDPVWSPGGSKIAFTSNRNGTFDLYSMNADGTNLTQLTNIIGNQHDATWSPDGSKIAFSSRHGGGGWDIYSMNADGTGVMRLTRNKASDQDPTWSPDGSKIAFVTDRNGQYDIYSIKVDGTGLTRLTNHPDFDLAPAWGANGKLIFTRQRRGVGEIYSMNADGSGVTRLTNHPRVDNSPHWP